MERPLLTRRRDFLVNLVLGLSVIPGFALAGNYVRRYLVPATARRTEEVLLSTLADLPKSESRVFLDVLGRDLLAVRIDEKNVKVFSSVCTHLGCRVGWDTSQGNFLCPCHVGRFDLSGRVIAGPPPAPLTEYQVRLDKELVYVTVPVKEA